MSSPDPSIFPLPFNLILKNGDGVRIEEAYAMTAARMIGIPVPRLLSYGSPGGGLPWGSILMTRIPGTTLDEVYHSLSDAELCTIKEDLAGILSRMRSFKNPWGRRICSVIGTSLTGASLPGGSLDPCEDETEFHNRFISIGTGCRELWEDPDAYEQALATARQILSLPHDITFTHGDLMGHNMLVLNGHITGIIDWESAGWMPEHWEYASAVRCRRMNTWWGKFILSLPGYRYPQELAYETAKSELTRWSF